MSNSRETTQRKPSGQNRSISMQRITEIAWAVDRVSRRAPEKLVCLPRALAVCQMVKRRGGNATLEIGVRKSDNEQLAAHAWVVFEGTIVIGAIPDLEQYSKLDNWPIFKGRARDE